MGVAKRGSETIDNISICRRYRRNYGANIYYNSGNVGIGTNDPFCKLDINQGTSGTTGATCFPLCISAGAYTANGNGTATLIGLSTYRDNIGGSAWYKCAVGHCRTGDYDKGSIVFLCNDVANGLSATMSDERMRITSTGNVGIGTNNPIQALHIHNNTTSADVRIIISDNTSTSSISRGFQILKGSANDAYLFNYENTPMIFGTNSAERMRITSTGNVGIGTNNPFCKLDINQGTSGTTGATCFPLCISAGAYTANGNGTATLIGLSTYRDNIGGSAWYKCAVGHCRTGDYDKGSIVFCCNNTGDTTSVTMSDERMRITSGGNVGIGTATPIGKLHVEGTTRFNGVVGIQGTADANGYIIRNNLVSSGSLVIGNMNQNYGGGSGENANMACLVLECLDNTEIMVHDFGHAYVSLMRYTSLHQITIGRNMASGVSSVFKGNNGTAWDQTSDHRIKENVKKANLTICYDNVKNINLYRFNYTKAFGNDTHKDRTQLGFIAQQVNLYYPKSITRGKRKLDDNKDVPDLASIDITQVNFTLFGAVKQLIRVVEKQSIRIKKLEEMLNIVADDEVENDADEPYVKIVCEGEVDIDSIVPSEPEENISSSNTSNVF